MKKVVFLLLILMLLVSCPQDKTQVYNVTIQNKSSYSIYWRIRRTIEPESKVFNKLKAYQADYLLIREDEDYSLDFALFDALGEEKDYGSFALEDAMNLKSIEFSAKGYKVCWKLKYF